MARTKAESNEIRRIIREHYLLGTKTQGTIQRALNEDPEFVKRFGTMTRDGVYYHIRAIRDELSRMVSEDALETYIPEFIRTRNSMDEDIDEAQKMLDALPIDECKTNPRLMEVRARIVNMIHQFRINQFKQLQDIELPITVAALNQDRKRRRLVAVGSTEGSSFNGSEESNPLPENREATDDTA